MPLFENSPVRLVAVAEQDPVGTGDGVVRAQNAQRFSNLKRGTCTPVTAPSTKPHRPVPAPRSGQHSTMSACHVYVAGDGPKPPEVPLLDDARLVSGQRDPIALVRTICASISPSAAAERQWFSPARW